MILIISLSVFISTVLFTGSTHGLPINTIQPVDPDVSLNSPKYEQIAGAFEGDIILSNRARGVASIGTSVRWPGGIVPYQFGSGHSSADQEVIIDAMRKLESWVAINNVQCIQFRPRELSDVYYITISSGTGCSSPVGKHQGTVTLQSPGCIDYGTIIHELLHTLGFFHEQSRPDRDSYVRIYSGNILSGNIHNFNKYNSTVVDTLNTSYDYVSLMHYEKNSFSIDGTSTTIEPLDPTIKIGQRYKMSDIDIQEVRLFYNCSATGPQLTTTMTTTTTASSSSTIATYASSLTTWHPMYARLSGSGSGYYYETIRVSVPSAGTWWFQCNGDMDTFASVYYLSFNASNPANKILASYDDKSQYDWRCLFGLTFPSSYLFEIVMTTYDQQVTGPFSITATGPALANLTVIATAIIPTSTTTTSTTTTTTTTTSTTTTSSSVILGAD